MDVLILDFSFHDTEKRMARPLTCSKKTILMFILMGSSLYVYHRFGGQRSNQEDPSTGIQQDTTGQGSLRLPSGETGQENDADQDTMEGILVSGESVHAVVDIGDHDEKLLAKSTRVKDGTGKHSQNKNGEILKTNPKIVNREKKHSSRYRNEGRSYPHEGREGRNYQENYPNEGTDGKNHLGRESSDGRNDRSSEVLEKRKHLPRFVELNTRKGKPGKSPSELLQETGNIENKEQNKRFCNIPFEYGEMCPTLYTDLRGYCEIDNTAPEGFDCPDIRRKGYNELRSTQLVLTRLLKVFDLVARKHGIKYWITSGTLLGAARHRGFIPWDEDADIQMPLDEYVKLFKCCKNKFPEGIFFQNSETDPYLRSTNETENRLLRHPVVGLYRRLWNPRLRDTKSCTKFCLEYGCDWADGLMIDIFIAEDTMDPDHLNSVFPLKEMLFEGFRFPVPGNWREILKHKYGDYDKKLGGDNDRIPEDNSDPFHSCEELKQAQKHY